MRVADAGAGAAQPCTCTRAQLVPSRIQGAGIPPRYADCTLENFEVDVDASSSIELNKARARCREYVETFAALDGASTSERGLLFMGPPGVGKTHLAVATLKALIRRYGVRGRFLDFSSFLAEIQATFDPSSSESKQRLLDPVIAAEVLVFDELGVSQPTPFVRDVLYLIINGRYSTRRPTLFTTNFQLKADDRPARADDLDKPQPFDLSARAVSHHDLLHDRLTPMLLSRVLEMARPIPITARDFRKVKVRASQRR